MNDMNIDYSEVDYIKGGKVRFGSCYSTVEALEPTCEQVAEHLLPLMDFKEEKGITVVFWTEGLPELIAFCVFSIDKKGVRTYKLDYSQSTL